MRTSDFDYPLPPERIAAHPPAKREEARLLILDKKSGKRSHKYFFELNAFLPTCSLIVINDTRVLPARLRSTKSTGGAIEIVLTRRLRAAAELGPGVEVWEALGRAIPRHATSPTFAFGGLLSVTVIERRERGVLLVSVQPAEGLEVLAALDRVGEVPLPPYIEAARRLATPGRDGRATAADRERYQSVYARHPGAVAAPTAGLHFTPELLAQLSAAGHSVVPITLHVGPGTFRPVETDEIAQHRMDAEWYEIPPATAVAVNEARRAGRPIVAVGTTVVRTLETAARVAPAADILAGPGESRLFLAPGSEFRLITDLITNFHLPRSTLLMLVSAFAGRENVLNAYEDAIARGYRFYSYGDAMLITWSRAAA